ncbi:MAG: tol-pal system protein YbgF [Nitrospiraceae bacterium]|nr:MAG: tol-pal system protein YbgF [Nitrospiraceae bacterium]
MKKFLPVVLLLLFSACASNTDFYRLKMEVNDLKKESATAKTEVDTLKERTAGTVKEDSFAAVRESQADMNSRINDLSSGLQEIRGRFEENKYFSENTLKETKAERDILTAQISSLESQMKLLKDRLSALEEASGHKEGVDEQQAPAAQNEGAAQKTDLAAPEAAPEKKQEGDERTKAYDAAYQSFKDKKYKEAREKFEAFIKANPKNGLTDNAQFWIAETYYAEKYYEDAILAYESLLKKYPDSKKTSSALLKQAFSFIEINDTRTGKIILNKLVEKYPGSKDAELAKKKLAELDKKSGKKK